MQKRRVRTSHKTQTDNSKLNEKVALRLMALNEIVKEDIEVLEVFGGNGVCWRNVAKSTNKRIKTTRIDKKEGLSGEYIRGDNLKILPSLNFEKYDIIDVDAYGIPFEHLDLLFQRKLKNKVIIVTSIRSVLGALPKKLYETNGIEWNMVKKCQSLFSKNYIDLMLGYLFKNNIKEIKIYNHSDKKLYFYFKN